MKKIFFLLIILIFAIGVSAQKVVNDPNAEVRTISSFHSLYVSNSFDVILTQGNEESLAVSANEKDYVQYIKTTVENGVLKIEYDEKKKWWPKNRKLKAYISVKNLDEIKESGASDIKIEGQLIASAMKLDMWGASNLNGKLIVSGKLYINLSGASDVDISGSAEEMFIGAHGASDVKAYDFKISTCKIEASGACTVHITVDKELSAKLSGASSVSYKGNAMIKDIKTSGASNISRKS